MARGIKGTYGVRTENDPARRISPPQSEQQGRGVLSPEGPYHQIGNSRRYTAPGGLMTVGFGSRTNRGPQSERPGRGIFAQRESAQTPVAPQIGPGSEVFERLGVPGMGPPAPIESGSSGGTQLYDQYGAFPSQITDLINNSQFTES